MSRREKRMEKQSNKTFRKIIIVALFLAFMFCVLKYAPNYSRDDIVGKTNLIINNNNITKNLNKDIFEENGVIYMAKEDISNFIDENIYYDEKYNQIITGSTSNISSIVVGENKMVSNGSNVQIKGSVQGKDDTYYIPISELDNVYNIKTTYIAETNTVVIDSLNKKQVVASSSNNNIVKYKPTVISRNVGKVEKGESLVLVNDTKEDGWVQVRTKNGKLGYMKQSDLANENTIREDMVVSNQLNTKVSMIWDYFSEYGQAPSRKGKLKGVNVVSPTFFTLKKLGKGEIEENVGDAGKDYIKWAHSNNYKVWPSISNSAMIDTTSEIMNDYKLRQGLINKIVSLVMKYELDGINIDFENMYPKDKELFTRFIIELKPRLSEIGATLSVDVTAPDGSENWSMCYNRHKIGQIADYIVFMAYDQNGVSSPEEGTTAGYDWTEVNLQKFVGTQEEVDPAKIILAVPFYTRLWVEDNGKVSSTAVFMKDIDDIVPKFANREWDDELKQYIVEYKLYGKKYKMWIEDEKSLEAKLSLIEKYKLSGAAYWQKGGESDNIWDLVTEKLGIE